VAGLTPDETITVEAGDNFFVQTEIEGNAGDVIEIIMQNNGTVTHNLRVAGPDNEYETGDDFESTPFAVRPGEQGRTVVKIDEAGRYLYRCDFHPLEQTGTLVLL
jgi:plastocyanin